MVADPDGAVDASADARTDAPACADGTAADDAGRCVDVDECLRELDDCDENATCNNAQGTFTCTCNAGYSGDGVTCTAATCDSLTVPTNGAVTSTNDGNYPSTATYTCDAGYTLNGPATRTCQTDGAWDGADPTCDPVPCDALSAPSHGAVSTSNENLYPSTATYACDPGYDRVGSETRTCGTDGTWSDSAPTCEPITCTALSAPDNGSIDVLNAGVFPSTATYACDPGYTLTGSAMRVCQTDGNWDGLAPTCSANACQTLGAPSNGGVTTTNSNLYPSTATYTCQPGYNMVGSDSRTCGTDGNWSGAAPSCEAITCDALSGPGNGSVGVTNSGSYPSTAMYACDAGYELVGSSTRTCQTNGSWDGSAPTCAAIPCTTLTAPSDGAVSTSNDNDYPSTATYSCSPGYTLNGSVTRQCQTDGNWDGAAPTCDPIACDSLTAPDHGDVSTTNSSLYPSIASYACDPGYTLTGSDTRTCGTDGSWSGSAPTCEPITCGALSGPSNGMVDVSNSGLYPSVATYACNGGYDLFGSSTRTCQTDGSWSGTAPTCQPISCDALSGPDNGTLDLSNTGLYPSTATYACNGGYVLSGTATRECQTDGSWDGAAPTCSPISCDSLSAPSNGGVSTTNSNLYPSLATYICDPGYDLVGTENRTCGTDGTWSGSAPTCEPITCDALSGPTNGSVVVTNTGLYPSVATYACDGGFNLVGSDTRTCQTDGTWSGIAPACSRVCDVVGAPANGTVSVSNGGVYPSVATYTCNTGYHTPGANTRLCLVDGSWHGSVPTCDLVGSVMVLRVGDGGAALNSDSTAVFLEERSITGGSLSRTINLPTSDAGSNRSFTLGGSSSTEGTLSQSSDHRFVTLAGYDTVPGTATPSATQSSSVNRVVARVDGVGSVDTSTAFNTFSTESPRGATSLDGSAFWICGGSGGVRYVPLGVTTTSSVSTTVANLRSVHIFDAQLYFNTAAGSQGVYTVGSGTPTTTGQVSTQLFGVTSSATFAVLDRSTSVAGPDTVYVAIETAVSGGLSRINVQKWTYNGSVWSQQTFAPAAASGPNTGARSLTAFVEGSAVRIVATTNEAASSRLVTFVDDGIITAPVVTALSTAGTNTAYRGVAPSPIVPAPSISPAHAFTGASFSITDPQGRIQAGAVVVFYEEGTDPELGVLATSVVVSADGTTVTGVVPSGLVSGVNYVSVRPTLSGIPFFGDLAFVRQ